MTAAAEQVGPAAERLVYGLDVAVACDRAGVPVLCMTVGAGVDRVITVQLRTHAAVRRLVADLGFTEDPRISTTPSASMLEIDGVWFGQRIRVIAVELDPAQPLLRVV